MTKQISKKLSANDIGETGGHQAGILIPKSNEILSFFPSLNINIKNPRITLLVRELKDSTQWKFNFIYYNNKMFGGTRNEFRLTCMTQYLRAIDAKVGDDIIFSKDENSSIYITHTRMKNTPTPLNEDGVLVLSGGWKVIKT